MEEIFLSYVGLLSLATLAIYAGAWGSLPPPPKNAVPHGQSLEKDEYEDERDQDERLSSSDAYLFPILASVALFGMYLVFKYLGKEWVNWILGWYFAFMGIGSVWKTSTALLRTILGQNIWRTFEKTKILITKNQRGTITEVLSFSCRTPVPFLFPFAVIPSALYMISSAETKPALITNILSLSFSFNALCLLKLDSFQTGTILLAGLFIYDIWWVFGTEVMVKVATTLDAPIKILWPKSSDLSSSKGFTMLGLGDIVIPGAFITLALRHDLFASSHKNPYRSFGKPYFTAALISYILGLITTMVVMHTWNAAQPALLYLSPSCILSFLITGLLRGELKQVWKWKDEPEQSKEDQNDEQVTSVLEPTKIEAEVGDTRPASIVAGEYQSGEELVEQSQEKKSGNQKRE